MVKQNEKLWSEVAISKNTSKVLQGAFQKMIHALEEIGIKLNKSQIVACHRLGKSERTIAKFLNKTNTENILVNKEKFTDIWKIVTDDTEVRSDQSPEV